MFRFFQKQSSVDVDFLDWTIALSKWVIANFDGLQQIRKTSLVKPTLDYFPVSHLSNHERAEELFQQTKKHADMDDWCCSLVPQSQQAPQYLSDNVLQKFDSDTPAGTYSERVVDGEIRSQITYDPMLLRKPAELIATFSHELAHLLMSSAQISFPFDEEMLEPATDGLAILMGFGIFILNASSDFRADDFGWEYHRSGYLCEGEIFHVLSAFCILSETPTEEAKPYLKNHHYKRLTEICNEIKKRDALGSIYD